MGLREWSLNGILVSPFLVYGLIALVLTGLLRYLLQRLGMSRWIWHEALFDTALYICVLAALTALVGRW